MGKLVLSRRPDESLKISINPDTVNVDALIAALTKGVTVTLAEIGCGQVRLMVDAPNCIRVDRAEWEDADAFHAVRTANPV
jgi:sRNA-binding carbon storage regulator CsrA